MRDRYGRRRPACPFCGRELDPPREAAIGPGSRFDGGSCPCGAVFGSDPRGNDLGALTIDVLVHACGGDWDLAWDFRHGEDFEEAWIYGYSERHHHVVPDTPGPRRGVGTIYALRLIGKGLERVRQDHLDGGG